MLRAFLGRFTKFDTLQSLGGWLLWPLGLTWTGLMAAVLAHWQSFWDAFGWLGVAGIWVGTLIFALCGLMAGLTVHLLKRAPPSVPEPAGSPSLSGEAEREQDGTLSDLAKAFADVTDASQARFEQTQLALESLSERVAIIEQVTQPRPHGLLDVDGQAATSRLDQIEIKLDRFADHFQKSFREGLSNTDGMKALWRDAIDRVMAQIKSNQDHSLQLYTILATSLRARDALSQLKEFDEIVMALGPKLIEADMLSYPCGQMWAADHNKWGYNLDRIDGLLGPWMRQHRPFHDIRRPDYESENRKAPDYITADEHRNATRYQQVCISQGRYEESRDGIFVFFATKAGDLPG